MQLSSHMEAVIPVAAKSKIAMCSLRSFLRRTVHCPFLFVWSFPNALA
jgi:hypothetical protein